MLARGETTADGKYLIDVKDPQCKQFDAIFLDIVMERSSGEEVCGRLRAAGIKCAIIAATGNGLRDDLKRYQDSGFSGVLLKPFASKAVVSSLSDLVVKKKSYVVEALVPCSAGGLRGMWCTHTSFLTQGVRRPVAVPTSLGFTPHTPFCGP